MKYILTSQITLAITLVNIICLGLINFTDNYDSIPMLLNLIVITLLGILIKINEGEERVKDYEKNLKIHSNKNEK